MDVVRSCLSGSFLRGSSFFPGLGRVGLPEQGECIRHTDGHAMTKNRGKQSFPPKSHAAKDGLFLLGNSHDSSQVKEVAFSRNKRLS
jgi:hypothetical protein